MLRSYQYTEKLYMNYSLQNDLFHDKEIEIAHRFVISHQIRRDMKCKCPVCGSESGKYFYTKWGVDYIRCNNCKSVFAVYDDDIVKEYHECSELKKLRLSDEYQEQISISRKQVWQDFLEWLEVRSFRFLKRNKNLAVVDIGNRLKGYSDIIKNSDFTGIYDIRESIFQENSCKISENEADIVLYLDCMKGEINPKKKLKQISQFLKKDGLLILNTRVGSGFDIITLRENNREIYPYEHILLPSVNGLTQMIRENGYSVLEVTTPGVMDLKYVMNCKDKLGENEGFVKYFLEEAGQTMLQEFQRFLQKSGLSSFVCVIARKEEKCE